MSPLDFLRKFDKYTTAYTSADIFIKFRSYVWNIECYIEFHEFLASLESNNGILFVPLLSRIRNYEWKILPRRVSSPTSIQERDGAHHRRTIGSSCVLGQRNIHARLGPW